jgi:predicted permease
MSMLRHDLRFALRTLRRSPGFTLAALAVIALGVGAATAVFALLHSVVLAPLPYPDPERLVMVSETEPQQAERENVSGPDFRDFREQTESFSALAAVAYPEMSLRPADGPPMRVAVGAASPELFTILGASPLHGGLPAPSDDRAEGAPVVLLGHGLWRSVFGGDPGVVGRTVDLDGISREVVGVLEEDFLWRDAEVFVPLSQGVPFLDERGAHTLSVIGRLSPGVSLARAQAEMDAVAARLRELYPEDNEGRGVVLDPLREAVVGEASKELWMLTAAVGLVLFVAGANVAGLWLLRAHARRHELAVRRALGAGRWRLGRQLATETTALCLTGGILGLVVAQLALSALLALRPEQLPRAAEIGIDGGAVALALGFSLTAGVIFGLLPLAGSSERKGPEALSRHAGRVPRRAGRAALVVAEIALALILVSGAALLGRSVWNLLEVDPGFRPGNVVAFQVQLPEGRYPMPSMDRYPEWPEVVTAYGRFRQRLEAEPGVRGVALAYNHPLEGGFTSQVTVVGRERPVGSGPPEEARVRAVSPEYHPMLEVPLEAGRYLTPEDRPGAVDVTLVNRAFAEKHFPAGTAVGEVVFLWGRELAIIGVVGDVRFQGLDRDTEPAIYPPLSQTPFSAFWLLVDSSLPPGQMIPRVRAAVAELEPGVALAEVRPLADLLGDSYGDRRFVLSLLAAFGAFALGLAAVGIYALVAYQVSERRREMGIRQALGASGRELLLLVLGEGGRMAAAGVLLGTAGSLVLMRGLAGFVYGVEPLDPTSLVLAAAVLAGVTLVATWLPARRAARVDPMTVLREE